MSATDPCNCEPLNLPDIDELNDVNEQLVCEESAILGGTAPCDLPPELENAWLKLCCMNKSMINILIELSQIINNFPKGHFSLASKIQMWTGEANSGTASEDFTSGRYEINWGPTSLGFTTEISIVGPTGGGITWQTLNTQGYIRTYSCNISVNGKNWSASGEVTEVSPTGQVTTSIINDLRLTEITKIKNIDFNIG